MGLVVLVLAGGLGLARAQQAGDVVAFFEVAPAGGGEKGDMDISMQRVMPDGKLLWGEGGNALAMADSHDTETSPAACDDGAGGVIVAYMYQFAAGDNAGDVDIVAQRVDPNGKLVWNDGKSPQPVASSKSKESHPVAVSDGRGGAIIVNEWTGANGDTDILAQRIDGNGKLLWGEGKTPVVVAASDSVERAPAVVSDGHGGVIVFFEWDDGKGDVDIMAQHLSADGEVLWNAGKRASDVAAGNAIERHVVAVPDGQGGAIAVFEYEPREGEDKGDVDIHAQRVSGDGVLLWNGGEKSAALSTAKGMERDPTAVPDGAGGVIAAFEVEPLEGKFAGDIDVLAQRLDSSGQWLWNEGKRSAVVSTGEALERAVRAIPGADGGAILVFEAEYRGGEHAGDMDILAQRLSPKGEMMWNNGERSAMVAASKWLERRPIPVSDGQGGAIVVYAAFGPAGGEFEGDVDLEAMRINGQGQMMWNEGKQAVDVAAGKGLERNPCVVVIGGK
jgi:hypothetical protein